MGVNDYSDYDWGPIDTSASGAKSRMGIYLSRSGGTATYGIAFDTISSLYYNGCSYSWEVDDSTPDNDGTFNWNHGSSSWGTNWQVLRTGTFSISENTTRTLYVEAYIPISSPRNPKHNRSVSRPASAPSAPGQPSVTGITTSGCSVAWSAPSDWGGDNSGDYELQIDDNGSFSSPSTTNQGDRAHVFSGLSPNTPYYLRVRAKNSAGAGPWSSVRSFTTSQLSPTPPTMGPVTFGSGQISAAWTPNPTSGGPYTSQQAWIRNVTDGGAWTQAAILSATAASYVFGSVLASKRYEISIRAYNNTGFTETVTQVDTTPAAPVSAGAIATETSVLVSWTNAFGSGMSVVNEVHRFTDGVADGVFSVGTAQSYEDTDITLGESYEYLIYATSETPTGNALTSAAASTGEVSTAPPAFVKVSADTWRSITGAYYKDTPTTWVDVPTFFVKHAVDTWSV